MRLIGLAVILAVGLVLRAEGQQAGKVPRVGYLSVTSAANGLHNLGALRAGLRAFGYVEGQSIAIEARWADGRIERLPQLAAELVRLPVDVLCTARGQASEAAQQATSTIPIVFANIAFPVQSGLVAASRGPAGTSRGSRSSGLNTGSG